METRNSMYRIEIDRSIFHTLKKRMLKAMFVFTVIISTLLVISVLHKFEIAPKDASTFVVIAVVCFTVITLLAAIIYACRVKLRNRNNPPDDHISRIDLPSTGNPTITSRPTLNQDILQMLQRLSQFPDYVIRTLPTYNKAMFSSAPMRVKKQESTEPPPEYITVTLPPPTASISDPAPPSYHKNTIHSGMTRSVSFHPFQPSPLAADSL